MVRSGGDAGRKRERQSTKYKKGVRSNFDKYIVDSAAGSGVTELVPGTKCPAVVVVAYAGTHICGHMSYKQGCVAFGKHMQAYVM